MRRGGASIAGGLNGACILSGFVLTCPRFMYYDSILVVPAALLAFTSWRELDGVARAILVMLTCLFIAAIPMNFGVWPWLWPFDSSATLGLWLWACVLLIRKPRPRT